MKKILIVCLCISIFMGGLTAFLNLALWNVDSPWNTTCKRMEREWGNYVYSMNMLPVDAPSQMLANLQRQINIPILGIEFDEKSHPIRAHLVNGQVCNINFKEDKL